MWVFIVFGVNGLCLFLIFLYTIHQYILVFFYLNKKESKAKTYFDTLPFITVQLPIYNEKYVLDSLFNSVSGLDYPKDKLEIQVLDDSTDESAAQVREKCEILKSQGFDCSYVHRSDRKDFKAGALAYGLLTAKGEFFAILDADFMPQASWLTDLIHSFTDKQIGFVQSRWSYSNRYTSTLTAVQAMALDHHFIIEQVGRNTGNLPFNFNGTAGIWRKTTIVDAGGWQGDTLTEDLDLSLRAQLRGWKSAYFEHIAVNSELPETMAAVRSQQFRWNKGGAQNLLKFSMRIFQAKISIFSKFNILAHLLNSSIFLFVFIYLFTSLPILYYSSFSDTYHSLLWPGAILKYNFIFIAVLFYAVHRKCNPDDSFWRFLRTFIFFFPYVMAISWHNMWAVLEAYIGKTSEFVRTPKFNSKQLKASFKANIYHKKERKLKQSLEWFWLIYFCFGIGLSFTFHDYSYLGIYITVCLGLIFISIKSSNE